MIFETLAAMADYADNKAFDLNSTAAECKSTLEDVTNTGTKAVIQSMTTSGTMNVTNEVLTVGGVTKTNNQNDWFNQHMVGLQQKQPRKVVEANSSNVVY